MVYQLDEDIKTLKSKLLSLQNRINMSKIIQSLGNIQNKDGEGEEKTVEQEMSSIQQSNGLDKKTLKDESEKKQQ